MIGQSSTSRTVLTSSLGAKLLRALKPLALLRLTTFWALSSLFSYASRLSHSIVSISRRLQRVLSVVDTMATATVIRMHRCALRCQEVIPIAELVHQWIMTLIAAAYRVMRMPNKPFAELTQRWPSAQEPGLSATNARRRSMLSAWQVRGDKMTILSPDDERIPMLRHLCARFDALLQYTSDQGGACAALRAVDKRSSPMLAVYPPGARYMRHTDNPDGNGRLLTMLFYLNSRWTDADGGCLRVFQGETGERECILPQLDRVVMFWSDARCPHEVLASHMRERYAISVWFHAPQESGGVEAMRAVAVAAEAARADKAAWTRAKVLAEGTPAEKQQQHTAEEVYYAALRSAASTLRRREHVHIRAADQQLIGTLRTLQRLVHGPSGLQWTDAPVVEGKMKILLHQLMTSKNLAAGCSKLVLAWNDGSDGVRWLRKPTGAKALVIMALGAIEGASKWLGAATVHCRRCTLRSDDAAPPGWPRATDGPVLIDPTIGTMHFFDCESRTLFVRLEGADAVGLWSFGAGADEPAITQLQIEAELMPDL